VCDGRHTVLRTHELLTGDMFELSVSCEPIEFTVVASTLLKVFVEAMAIKIKLDE
jgi:hypothetical protein